MSSFFPQLVVFNRGISFGLLASPIWLLINFIFLALIIKYLSKNFAWDLIVGGGVSNLLDRFVRGKIIDFIDLNGFMGLKDWQKFIPVFNLADVFISLGIMLVGLQLLGFWPRKKIAKQPKNC